MPSEKMIAIDRVIHEFHYSIKELPDLPTRLACVNLIEGRLTSVLKFLVVLPTARGSSWLLEENRAR